MGKEKHLKAKSLQFSPNSNVGDLEKQAIAEMLSPDWQGWNKSSLPPLNDKNARDIVMRVINAALNSLAFNDRDEFLKRFDFLFDEEVKNNLWQENHRRILSAINNLTLSKGRFPSRVEISTETSLSQRTVNKHLKNYFGSNEYFAKREEMIMLRENVLASMFKEARSGDPRAAKVFLMATDQFTQPPIIKNQTNYIQINGLVITQEQLSQLPAEKLNEVHQILALVSPQKTLQHEESKELA